jgi:hypothetical protein
MLVVVSSARGQAALPKPSPSTKQAQWRKYVNHQHRFSFWYPMRYRAGTVQQLPPESEFHNVIIHLLSLEDRDDPEVSIVVTIDLRPFQMGPRGPADGIPPPRKIGERIFYSYSDGSPLAGFSDVSETNLKGKTLIIAFSPTSRVVSLPSPSELQILNTFRTF